MRNRKLDGELPYSRGTSPSADKQILKPVVVEITGNGHGGIDSVQIILKSAGIQRKIPVTVIFKQAVLHLPAVGLDCYCHPDL